MKPVEGKNITGVYKNRAGAELFDEWLISEI
jgi:hypothetical protein